MASTVVQVRSNKWAITPVETPIVSGKCRQSGGAYHGARAQVGGMGPGAAAESSSGLGSGAEVVPGFRAREPDMLTDNILDLIGNTPLLELRGERIFAKAEFLNPGGSIKDRVALAMLEGAERDGKLKPGSIIVEPTSGNTGIGIALVGRLKGYQVRIVMPEGMSQERKQLIRALGAELILTPSEESIAGAVRRAEQLVSSDPGFYLPNQFANPDNPRVHYETTARELWRQTGGNVDCFVAGVGSGGTLQGVGRFLKEHKPGVRIVAVEPKNVSALLGHEPGLHQIQGIGDGFIPPVLDVSLIDEVIEVTDEDAIATTRALGSDYGLLVGISSGANVWAARELRKRSGGTIATVLPDRVERYFSTALLERPTGTLRG
jgi:cysteine synthase A